MSEKDQKPGTTDQKAFSFGLAGRGLSVQVEARVGANPSLKVSFGAHDKPEQPVKTDRKPSAAQPQQGAAQAASTGAESQAATAAPPATPAAPAAPEAPKSLLQSRPPLSDVQAALRSAYMTSADAEQIDYLRFSLSGMRVINGMPTAAQAKALLMLLPDDLFGKVVSWGFRDPGVREELTAFIAGNIELVTEAAQSASKG